MAFVALNESISVLLFVVMISWLLLPFINLYLLFLNGCFFFSQTTNATQEQSYCLLFPASVVIKKIVSGCCCRRSPSRAKNKGGQARAEHFFGKKIFSFFIFEFRFSLVKISMLLRLQCMVHTYYVGSQT
jgi:hypothetical protein